MGDSDIDWKKAVRALRNRFRARLPACIESTRNPLELLSAIIALVALKILRASAGLEQVSNFDNASALLEHLQRGAPADLGDTLPRFSKASFEQAEDLLSKDDKFALLWNSVSSLGFVYQIWGDTFRSQALDAVQTPNKEISNETLISFTQVYTPPWVVDYLLAKTLVPLFENAAAPSQLRLLDPACGAGHFLLTAFDYFKTHYSEAGLTPAEFVPIILKQNLFGTDIDRLGLSVSAISLNLKALAVLPTFNSIELNLSITDRDSVPLNEHTSAKILPLGSIDPIWVNKSDHFLSKPFDVVVTNPPYIGRRLLSRTLKEALSAEFPLSKSDLNAAFIEGSLRFLKDEGYFGAITQASLLALPSYQEFRKQIERDNDVVLAEPCGTGVFPLLSGEKANSLLLILKRNTDRERNRQPFAFNKAEKLAPVLEHSSAIKLSELADIRQGLATTDNQRFVRYRWEVDETSIGTDWVPYIKGAGSERWIAANYHVVKWSNNGEEIKQAVSEAYPYLQGKTAWVVKNEQFYFKEGLCFSFINKDRLAVRELPPGSIFDVASSAIFAAEENRDFLFGYLNSSIASQFANSINPTINLQVGDVKRIPVPSLSEEAQRKIARLAKECMTTKREFLDLLERCTSSRVLGENGSYSESFDSIANRVELASNTLGNLEGELDEFVFDESTKAFSLNSTLQDELRPTGKQNKTREHDLTALAARYVHGMVGALLTETNEERPAIIEKKFFETNAPTNGHQPSLQENQLAALESALGLSLQKYFDKSKVLDLARKFRGPSRYISVQLPQAKSLLLLSARAVRSFAKNGSLSDYCSNPKAKQEAEGVLNQALAELSKIENWRTQDLISQLDLVLSSQSPTTANSFRGLSRSRS